MSKAETEFDKAMMDIYRRAKSECNYTASYFLGMLLEHRGVETARILLAAESPQEGFTRLWERGRLDLTVECLVLSERFRGLFGDHEREKARSRLREYDFDPEKCERKSGKPDEN